jgi:hypothetical protein
MARIRLFTPLAKDREGMLRAFKIIADEYYAMKIEDESVRGLARMDRRG